MAIISKRWLFVDLLYERLWITNKYYVKLDGYANGEWVRLVTGS